MTVSNHTDDAIIPAATTLGAAGGAARRLLNRDWLVPSVLAVLCLLAYVPFLPVSPLLDEQFLLAFCRAAGHHGVPLGSFIGWHGPDVADLWGPATTLFLKVSQIILFGSPFMLRAESLLLHIIAAILLFLVTARMTEGRLLPFACAALFALYPLNPESVLWLGGKGSQLAGVFSLAALYAYQKTGWRWLIASLVLYGAALLCSACIWTLVLVFTVWELFSRFVWRRPGTVHDGTLAIVAPLGFFVLTAAYVAGSGLLFQLGTTAAPDVRPGVIFQTLRGCFLPINESIYPHYIRHYRFLYFLMAPLLVSLIVGLVRDAKLRSFVAFCTVWLALLLVPLFGHVDVRGTMYGSHLLYAAAAPAVSLLAAMLLSLPSVLPRGRVPCTVISCLALIAMLGFYAMHTAKQNSAYASGGRLLTKVQKSIGIVRARVHAPLIPARDIPESVAIMPAYRPSGMMAFDAGTSLLSASTISGGRLKDALKDGKLADVALRWDHDLQSLVPLDVIGSTTPKTAVELSAGQIAQRLVPGIEFYKNAHMDEQTHEIMLESNSTSGPAIKLRADNFAPLAPDFLCVDAKIDAPDTGIKPAIELYWTTREHSGYDSKERRLTTPAYVGDNQYHRYFLPLRGIGWVTGGPADLLTLGFPAGAKVWLHSISAADKDKVIPQFNAVPQSQSAMLFDPPFFNFPTNPQLGLFRIPPGADSVVVSHSCENLAGATGVMIEISMANRLFPNTNGADQSGVAAAVIGIDGVKGTYGLPIAKFPVPGLYSLRAVAMDANHHPMGNFSDDVYCLVTRKNPSGWSP